MLTIGLAWKQRAIPLVWMVYEGKKGHHSAHKLLRLLEQVKALLPEDASVIVTGDAEFNGTEMIPWLLEHPNWHYAIRTAKNSVVRATQSTSPYALQEMAPLPGENKLPTGVHFFPTKRRQEWATPRHSDAARQS